MVARRQVIHHHDELRDIGLREHLVQRQIETRHARAHPHCHALHPGLCPQEGLHALGHLLIAGKRSPLGEPGIHQDLRPVGIRKELLLHPRHAEQP